MQNKIEKTDSSLPVIVNLLLWEIGFSFMQPIPGDPFSFSEINIEVAVRTSGTCMSPCKWPVCQEQPNLPLPSWRGCCYQCCLKSRFACKACHRPMMCLESCMAIAGGLVPIANSKAQFDDGLTFVKVRARAQVELQQ